ncbi:MAG TPA: ferritin-like domain-containing protein [Puia sp.]|nr:ferritin-like domain-containing protein [Puia sp.]
MQKTMEKNAKASSRDSQGQEPQLEELFIDMLKDIYWAEKHLTKALPKMKKAATTSELQNAFEDHLAQTEGHVSRLEKAFELMGKKAQAKKCEAMAGLTKEADEMAGETEKGSMTRDVALIAAGQKVEHYEIATYGTLVQLASDMHHNEVASLLEETLKEEKEADSLLTEIAENKVNWQAVEGPKGGSGQNGNKKNAKK